MTGALAAQDVLDELGRRGVIAVIRATSADHAVAAARALAEGGVTAIEITFTVPDAAVAIATLAQDGRLLVGAGTVLDPGQADDAVRAGANYLVMPHFDADLVDAAHRLGVPAIPGVFTPTEIVAAARRCRVVKLFPAGAGGPAMLRALRGPFPDVAFLPSGGVRADNIGDWLDAGAYGVSAGADLCPAAALERGDTGELTRRAQAYAAAVAHARRVPPAAPS
jgi:2-dehydro-3-deoxyphosphogluconate aldolase / (4S)-4-hydroxy-2-oxoglutarate aldolase